jgi:signal transduction histidine kinase
VRIRYAIFLATTIATIIPAVFLGIWPQSRAFEDLLDDVSERHLLIAQNTGRALERYARDVVASFNLLAQDAIDGANFNLTLPMMENLNIRHICIANISDGKVKNALDTAVKKCPSFIPEERLTYFKKLAATGGIQFSSVRSAPDGTPVIYVVRRIDDLIAVSAISTEYFVELGSAIAFGKKGHAAIVDHTGKILAHPLPEWRKAMRDISQVRPVKRMIKGQTGVTTFFSPALKGDMVAGYTVVKNTGWGVMIPQPVSELRERADTIRMHTLGIVFFGIVVAGFVSWIISGYLTQPVQDVVDAARRISNGEANVRVPTVHTRAPSELKQLRDTFNSMAAAVELSHAKQHDALESAEHSDRAKTDFLANMSHELRTPLTAIIGFSQAIHNEIFSPLEDAHYKQYARNINDSGQHLLALINDLLDMSKIEAGAMNVDETTVDMPDLIDQSFQLLQTKAATGNISLQKDIPEAGMQLWADERHILQILINLVSNAIKFTPSGGSLNLTLAYTDQGDPFIRATDTGIGIPENDLAHIFNPFHQAGNALTRQHHGTGLGLAIVRRLTELHGGSATIDSTVGQGTIVNIIFPRHRLILNKTT